MEFVYSARDASGKTQEGSISAPSKDQAIDTLRKRNLTPVTVKPAGSSGLKMNIKLPGSGKVKPKALVVFTRQFATMISAGVPMLRSLTTLREQSSSPALKEALGKIISDVEGGAQLSDSLAKHPKAFSEVYVNMVRAGEAGGILDQILNRLATQVEKDAQIKGKFKSAMVYPLVVTLVAVGAVSFLMVSVVPKLASILQGAGGKLPLQTKVVLAISDFMTSKWYILIGAIILAVFLFRRLTGNPKGKYAFHKFLLRIPIFGNIILKVNVARFARTFSSLLAAGVTVIEALNITSGALTNLVVRKALTDSVESIKNGSNIATSLGQSNILPAIIIQMTAVGEETGKIGEVLDKVAEFYEDEVDAITSGLSSIIEPILIVGLGGIVGFIVMSVLGPIISIQGAV
ncbi:type II secretion system F family protein [Candidatus Saccharibacteria bacterium]|nr:type II secretion system F family protein [Candidatus Saccharibacteria bacterium]